MQSQTIVAAIHRPDNQIVLVNAHKPVPVITKRTVSYRSSAGTSVNNFGMHDAARLVGGKVELLDFNF